MPVRSEASSRPGRNGCRRRPVRGRDDILAAVAKVFARRGYHGTDMDLVAEAIRSSKGTVYNYFRSKEELFLAAVDLGLRRLRAAVDAGAAAAPGPRERVSRAISTCVAFFDANPEFAELLIQGARSSRAACDASGSRIATPPWARGGSSTANRRHRTPSDPCPPSGPSTWWAYGCAEPSSAVVSRNAPRDPSSGFRTSSTPS